MKASMESPFFVVPIKRAHAVYAAGPLAGKPGGLFDARRESGEIFLDNGVWRGTMVVRMLPRVPLGRAGLPPFPCPPPSSREGRHATLVRHLD